MLIRVDIFNKAQPGVGRVQVLGSKFLQKTDEQFFWSLHDTQTRLNST